MLLLANAFRAHRASEKVFFARKSKFAYFVINMHFWSVWGALARLLGKYPVVDPSDLLPSALGISLQRVE